MAVVILPAPGATPWGRGEIDVWWFWTNPLSGKGKHKDRVKKNIALLENIFWKYIFKRLRATAGQGPNYVGPLCGYVGLCWPHVDLCWAKRSEKWEQPKKHCKTQDILMVGGLSWGYVGPSWGYVGLSWGQCGPILGLCWPILGLCWPILELWWPILGLSWPIFGRYVGPSCGLLRPMLAHVDPRSEKWEKVRRAQNTVKRGGFWRGGVACGRGRRPLSPTERRETPSARTRPGGPWPDLSAYARQPARGPTMLAHFVASWGYVGLSWGQCGPILGLCWPILKAMWADLEAYVDPCWAKRAEKWEQQKNHCKTQDILTVGGPSWGYVGPSWGYVGPSWRYVGPSWGLCWPILRAMLAHVDPSWGYVGPAWGYVGPSWSLCWPRLRPMLAHVDPS